jgi:hypothetical protein
LASSGNPRSLILRSRQDLCTPLQRWPQCLDRQGAITNRLLCWRLSRLNTCTRSTSQTMRRIRTIRLISNRLCRRRRPRSGGAPAKATGAGAPQRALGAGVLAINSFPAGSCIGSVQSYGVTAVAVSLCSCTVPSDRFVH